MPTNRKTNAELEMELNRLKGAIATIWENHEAEWCSDFKSKVHSELTSLGIDIPGNDVEGTVTVILNVQATTKLCKIDSYGDIHPGELEEALGKALRRLELEVQGERVLFSFSDIDTYELEEAG